MRHLQPTAIIFAAVLALTGCPRPRSAELVSISISPENARINRGGSTDFVATGIYADGAVKELTNEVVWQVVDGFVATVDAEVPGRVHGVNTGTTRVRAISGEVSRTLPFTVVGGASTASGSVPNGSALGTAITTDSGGDIDLIISPPIVVPGTSDGVSTAGNTAFATVSAAPVDGAAVTHLGAAGTTRRVRAAWHKSAITLVSARLQTPFTGESSFATDPETGISIRYWRGSDISTGAHVHRWDCLYGAENLDPLMGYQISGS